MFKGAFFTYKDLLRSTNQEEAFRKYGIQPELGNKRYFSLFRRDKTPDCRFEVHDGILFFIDNAGYQGKTAFSAIDTISILEQISFNDALKVYQEVVKNKHKTISLKKYEKKKRKRITFKAVPFTKNNMLSKYGIPHEYWDKQDDVHNVLHYFIDGFQYRKRAIAFTHENRVKLYFPYQTNVRFISNFKSKDILLLDKINWDAPIILISKSRIESALFDYYLNLQSIVQLNERVPLYDKLLKELTIYKNSGGRVISLMDNDNTGREMTKLYVDKHGFESITPVKNDFADDFFVDNLKRLKHEIYNR